MTWKPQRRGRWADLNAEQTIVQIADDMDVFDAVLHEHIEEDMSAHDTTARALEEWKLSSLRSQNRMLFAVVLALIAAIVSILVPLVTR